MSLHGQLTIKQDAEVVDNIMFPKPISSIDTTSNSQWQQQSEQTRGEKLVCWQWPAMLMRSHRPRGTLLIWLADTMLLAWMLLMYGNWYSGQPGVCRSTATNSSSARISNESGSSLPIDKHQTILTSKPLSEFMLIPLHFVSTVQHYHNSSGSIWVWQHYICLKKNCNIKIIAIITFLPDVQCISYFYLLFNNNTMKHPYMQK